MATQLKQQGRPRVCQSLWKTLRLHALILTWTNSDSKWEFKFWFRTLITWTRFVSARWTFAKSAARRSFKLALRLFSVQEALTISLWNTSLKLESLQFVALRKEIWEELPKTQALKLLSAWLIWRVRKYSTLRIWAPAISLKKDASVIGNICSSRACRMLVHLPLLFAVLTNSSLTKLSDQSTIPSALSRESLSLTLLYQEVVLWKLHSPFTWTTLQEPSAQESNSPSLSSQKLFW